MLRLNEAMSLFDELLKDLGNPVSVLTVLLPQMATVDDARKLVDVYMGTDMTHRRILRFKMGNSFLPLMGYHSAYYMLDFSKKVDRVCFSRLLEHSNDTAYERMANGFGDISQDGNWSSFRNVFCKGKQIRVDANSYDVIPSHGSIEFDFVSSVRPHDASSIKAFSDRRFVELLHMIRLLPEEKIEWARLRLDEMLQGCSNGQANVYFSCDLQRALDIANYVRIGFTARLGSRKAEVEDVMKTERISETSITNRNSQDGYGGETSSLAADGQVASGNLSHSGGGGLSSSRKTTSKISYSNDKMKSKDSFRESKTAVPYVNTAGLRQLIAMKREISTLHLNSYDIVESASSSFDSSAPPVQDLFGDWEGRSEGITFGSSDIEKRIEVSLFKKAEEIAALSMKYSTVDNYQVSRAYNLHLIDGLERVFNLIWITCRQLTLLIELMPCGALRRTSFGSYRVELIVALYSRIKDLHNFDLILAAVDAEDHGALLARLGYLAFFNPLKPDGCLRLNLSIWEQRQASHFLVYAVNFSYFRSYSYLQITKVLLHLSFLEPGENWIGETYSSHPNNEPMPGWELSVVWFSESGLPKMGILTVTYFSGNNKNENGCRPDYNVRFSLLAAVAVRFVDVMADDVNNYGCGAVAPATLTDLHALLKSPDGKTITWTYDYTTVKLLPGVLHGRARQDNLV